MADHVALPGGGLLTQWSWPVNLPPPFRVDRYLEDGDLSTPWAGEIEQAIFRPPVIGIGPANEVVFFHKPSRTLLVTDLCIFIDPATPSPIIEPADLLKSAREEDTDPVPPDSPAARKRGWARMALQILFLGPTAFSTFARVSNRVLVSPVTETFIYSKVGQSVAPCVHL